MTKVCGKIRTGSLPEKLEAGETQNKESGRCGGSHMGKNEMFRISIGLFYNINKQSRRANIRPYCICHFESLYK